MLVLGIETATDVCAVGLVGASGDLAEFALLRPRRHGAALAGLVHAALDAAGEPPEALDAVAVSAGPGSYTGLRIGLSTAKGLCMAAGAALVSVPTLRAQAEAAGFGERIAPLVVALPSRRGEVYAEAFQPDPAGWRSVAPAAAVGLTEIAEWAPPSGSYALAGPARHHVGDALRGGKAAPSLQTLDARPSGLVVARLGRQRLLAGETEDLAAFEPAYLKPFVSGGAPARG